MAKAQKNAANNNTQCSSRTNTQNTDNATVAGSGHHEATRQNSRYLTESSDVKAKSKRVDARQNGIEQLKDRTERENKAQRGRVRRRGPGRDGWVQRPQKAESDNGNTGNSETKAADLNKMDRATDNSHPKWKDDKNLGRPGQDPAWEYDHSD